MAVADWFRTYRIMPSPAELSAGVPGKNTFSQGRMGMVLEVPDAMAALRNATFEWALAENPRNARTGRASTSADFGIGYLHSNPHSPALAEAFIRYLLSEEAQRVQLAFGRPSTHINLAHEFENPGTPQDEMVFFRAAAEMKVRD